jgi:two-component system, sensor histidine kinase and response regulator
MTNHAMAGRCREDLACGMDGCVSKPIHVQTLRAEIERLTKHRHREVIRDMTSQTKEPSNSAIDLAELLARVENDRELLLDLVSIFKEDFPKRLRALHQAVDTGDAKQVAAVAHTLKGMLSNLAAHRAAAGAAKLEQLGRNGDIPAFPNAFFSLERETTTLLNELDASLTEVGK